MGRRPELVGGGFSTIIAALIIGTALIVISRTPLRFHDISLIAIIGYLAAAVMGIWLLVAIILKSCRLMTFFVNSFCTKCQTDKFCARMQLIKG